MTRSRLHAPHRETVMAVLFTCLAYALFNVGDAAVKMLALRFHFTQVLCLNAALIILAYAAYNGFTAGIKSFRAKNLRLVLLRAAVGQVTMVCNVLALPHVRLTTFYTLVFTSPLWVALLSSVFMRERMEARRMAVMLFGFAVVLWIFSPGHALPDAWMLLVLLGAFAYACQLLILRRIGRGENRPLIFMYGSAFTLFLFAPFLPGHVMAPTPAEWGLFLLVAAVSCVGLVCIAHAFQTAPSPSLVAPYHYTQIAWGALLGWILFREVPDARLMAGAVAIIAAGLYLVWGETRRPVLRPGG